MIRNAVRKLKGYTPGEQSQKKVIKLNTNENPYPLPDAFYKNLKDEVSEVLRLYPDPLFRSLRKKLGTFWKVDPETIVCGNGSDEILRLIIDLTIEPGDKIGTLDPTYSLYDVLAEIREAEVQKYPVDAQGNPDSAPFDFDGKLFIIANPNAPYGNLICREWIEQFLENYKGLVLIDEAYGDFSGQSWIPEVEKYDNLVVCRTYSKSFSLAGIRFGYCMCSPFIAESLYKIKDSYNLNMFTQWAAEKALDYWPEIEKTTAHIVQNRGKLTEAFEKMGWQVLPSAANFIFARHPRAKEVFSKLKEQDIFVRYFDIPVLADGIRVSIGTDEECEILIQKVQQILKAPGH